MTIRCAILFSPDYGYKKALKYYNLPVQEELIKTGGFEAGYKWTKALLQLRERPTAIFSAVEMATQNGTITWWLANVPAAGTYEIAFGYRSPYDTPKHQYINVNGARVAEVVFNGSLNTWLEKKLNVNLVQDNNTIQMVLFWGWLAVPGSIVTSVARASAPPAGFSLQQNFPNPFWREARSPAQSGGNPATIIRYSLAKPEHVKLVVYDMPGRPVHVLVDRKQSAGAHEISSEGGNLASGVYFYRLQAGAFVDEKRLLLVE